MENVNKVKRSELYKEILTIVKKIDRVPSENDTPDHGSVAYELEQLFLNKNNIKDIITNFENELEKEATLITEAVGDVIGISSLNSEKDAFNLIKTQFVVIDRQDLEPTN